MMTIHKAKSPTQVHFRLGRDKRIFEKHKTNKQTHYLNNWVIEGTSKATQLRLHAQIQILERQNISVDKLLYFNLQGELVLLVMTLCPLMESTKEIRSPTSRQFLRYRRRCLVWTRFSLSKVGSSSAYFIGIRSYCGALWAWCWGWHFTMRTSWSFLFELSAGTLSLINRPSRTPSSWRIPMLTI